MGILKQLSSSVGDRTEDSNRKVVAQILAHPALLAEVAEGLKAGDASLLGDCAEVMTMVAEEHPEWVAPYAEDLTSLLGQKKARVRWEATHALSLVAALSPEVIASSLPRLEEVIRGDPSIIVRDYALDAVSNYAEAGAEAAKAAYPILKQALEVWGDKHIARILKGFSNVASLVPSLACELRALGEAYLHHRGGVVRKAAKALVRAASKTIGEEGHD